MPVQVEPTRHFKCTYEDCMMSFDTDKEMKRHKKNSDEHDYCAVCDEDFPDYEQLAMHKVLRPDMHGKACRVCGDEFKSTKGLQRHIELSHQVDQKLSCVGCGKQFPRASLLIEHLEFNHCEAISANEFLNHITHKVLITELLKGGRNFDRFIQKTSKFEATVDHEVEGGVNIMDETIEDTQGVEYEAIQPEIGPDIVAPERQSHFPPLPTPKTVPNAFDSLAAKLDRMALSTGAETESTTVVGTARSVAESSVVDSTPSGYATPSRRSTAWGGSSAQALFSKPASTIAASECYSVEQLDQEKEAEHGINILTTRFWDPECEAWNPYRFFDSMRNVFVCPFVCEQSFLIPADLALHIKADHQIRQMRCPSCLKLYKSATALVAHCESRGAKCRINKADDFGTFLDRLTGGFLGVEEKIRPDHEYNPSALVKNPDTGHLELYNPPQAHYLKYEVTKPAGYKEPQKTFKIGGGRID